MSDLSATPQGRIVKEPKMRADKVCARKDCNEPLNELTIRAGDPFHTALCARVYYQAATETDIEQEGRPTTARPGGFEGLVKRTNTERT